MKLNIVRALMLFAIVGVGYVAWVYREQDWTACLVCLFILLLCLFPWWRKNEVSPHRGRKLTTFEAASTALKKHRDKKETVYFGGLNLPSEAALLHFGI